MRSMDRVEDRHREEEMSRHREGRGGWAPFALLAGGAGVFAFLPARLAPPADLYTGAGDEAGHLAAGFLITLALLAAPEVRRSRRLTLLALAAAAALSGLVELLQPLAGRACQFIDWRGDLAGVLLAGLCRLPFLARSPHRAPARR